MAARVEVLGELGAAREAARRDNPASGGRAIGRIREGPVDFLTRKFIGLGRLDSRTSAEFFFPAASSQRRVLNRACEKNMAAAKTN
jgi:hypothetical protein